MKVLLRSLFLVILALLVQVQADVNNDHSTAFGAVGKPYLCQPGNSTESCFRECCVCYNSTSQLEDVAMISGVSPFVVISLVLVLVLVPLIVFCNINVASGPKQSLLLFYHCLPLATPFGKFTAVLTLQNQLYNIPFPYIRPLFPPLVAPLYVLEYGKYFIVVFIMFLALFLVRCNWCPFHECLLPWAKVRRAARNFRGTCLPNRTFLKGLCSLVILAYGNLVSISSIILTEGLSVCCHLLSDATSSNCWEDSSFMAAYTWYFVIAAIILVLLLPLPLSLIYYPSIPAFFNKLTGRSLPRFPKLDPVFDVFQGVYKDKMRWFAGVHLFYRLILWCLHSLTSIFADSESKRIALLFGFTIILAVHSIFQPYKKSKHNYVEGLLLVDLVLIAISYHTYMSRGSSQNPLYVIVLILQFVLGLLPLFGVIVYYCANYCCKAKCFKDNMFVHLNQPAMGSEEDLSYILSRDDMNELTVSQAVFGKS